PGMGFGAGPTVRGGRRAGAQRIGPGARARLMEAHRLKEGGQFTEAAARFSEMAGIARERQMMRMATTLSGLAAQCAAAAGDKGGLVAATEAAIGDAKVDGDAKHSARTFGELLGALEGTPFAGARGDFEGAIRSALGVTPSTGSATPDVNRTLRRTLPSECDECGAPVESAALRFSDDGHADCPYCGSILTA
ncbi:MAG: hypothetical protein ABMA64_37900, partial [Myxococcota bacterium]